MQERPNHHAEADQQADLGHDLAKASVIAFSVSTPPTPLASPR
jgi:hypothetical protein